MVYYGIVAFVVIVAAGIFGYLTATRTYRRAEAYKQLGEPEIARQLRDEVAPNESHELNAGLDGAFVGAIIGIASWLLAYLWGVTAGLMVLLGLLGGAALGFLAAVIVGFVAVSDFQS
jgi:hypothetical protein